MTDIAEIQARITAHSQAISRQMEEHRRQEQLAREQLYALRVELGNARLLAEHGLSPGDAVHATIETIDKRGRKVIRDVTGVIVRTVSCGFRGSLAVYIRPTGRDGLVRALIHQGIQPDTIRRLELE